MKQIIADGDNPYLIPYRKGRSIVQGGAQESSEKIVYERKGDSGQDKSDYGGIKGVEGGEAVL